MKILRQSAIIAAVCAVAELIKYLLPLPIPASVYGLILMLLALLTGLIKPEQISTVADFFISIMPVLFIAPTVALITQPEHLAVMGGPVVLLGILGIHLMETVRKKQKTALYLMVSALVVVAGAVLGTLGMVDYYGAGVLTVFIFYFFHGRKWWCLLGQLAALYWVNVELLGGLMYPIQLFGMDFELCQQGLALLALVPIWLYRGRQGYHSKPFQYACYAFYPVHMLLLALVLNFVNR